VTDDGPSKFAMETIKLHFENQRTILEALTFLILRTNVAGSEEAMEKFKNIQAQWIATMRMVETVSPAPPEEVRRDN
jgi:hypothetical protein